MRTFVAIEIPEGIRREIYSVGLMIPGKVSRVSERNIHITLQFLGELDEATLPNAKKALDGIKAEPFPVSVRGISYFGRHEVRTIYANVIDDGATARIYKKAARLLNLAGLSFETERSYVPHATIARLKQPNEEAEEFVSRNLDRIFGEFRVSSICLKSSVLSAEGPVYTNLYERELG